MVELWTLVVVFDFLFCFNLIKSLEPLIHEDIQGFPAAAV